jgi:endonuclease YncB( thermonuclease family)
MIFSVSLAKIHRYMRSKLQTNSHEDYWTWLNEEIVKAGYANVMTIPPNVRYQDRFLRVYKQARERKRGLWEE